MHIALIVRKLDIRGGVQRQALSLARELLRIGNRITLYTFSYDPERCFPEIIKDIPVVCLLAKFHRPTGGIAGFLNESRMARDLARLIAPDTEILHPHDAPMHHVAYWYKRDVKNIPSVWQMNELPGMRWPPEFFSFTENPLLHDIPYRPLWFRRLSARLRVWYEGRFIQAQNGITVFDTYHQRLLKRFTGQESVIVPSGFDSGRIPFIQRRVPTTRAPLRLLSSGIFLSYRRFEDIIAALPIVRNAGYDPHLDILGEYRTDKRYYEALKKLAADYGVQERVAFHGSYADDELIRFFAESHIFVFPHLQSQGISVYEAIASGLPTIITPLCDTYETLRNREQVIVAAPKNPESIAQSIKTLLEEPRLYEQISRQGAEYVRSSFSWERYGREMEAVLRRVLNL